MTPNEYQELAITTLAPQSTAKTLINCALGIAGETGEICDLIKKHRFHKQDTPLNTEKIIAECGDTMWYIAVLTKMIDIELDDVTPVVKFRSIDNTIERCALQLSKFAGYFSERTLDNYYLEIEHEIHGLLIALALMLSHFDTTLEQAMQTNIDKLAKRHKPNGEATGFISHYASDSGDSLKS